MKSVLKIFLILILAQLSTAAMLQAQINWGIEAAVNRSTTFNSHLSNYYRTGFDAGIIADIHVSKFLFLSSGLLYSNKGQVYFEDSWGVMDYINMPILAGHKFGNHFEILLGAELGYLVRAVALPGTKNELNYIDQCRRFELALNGSARYKFGKRLTVDLSFSRGLTGYYKPSQYMDITFGNSGQTSRTYNEISSDQNFKNQSVQLGVIFFITK